MRRKVLLLALLATAVFSAAAFGGFDAYFADSSGQKIGTVWEGERVYVVVEDPEKGACGIDEFQADLVIFDFKTGAYIWVEDDPNTAAYEGAWFRELGGAGTGKYFWVTGPGSTSKVVIPVGSRADFATVPYGQTHVLGQVSPAPVGVHAAWEEGAWEYVDEDVLGNNAGIATTAFNAFPENKLAARVDFEGLGAGRAVQPGYISGRLENMDTLILIVSDATDERNIDQDQVKIQDTVNTLTVTPSRIVYGCGGTCENITVRIVDHDENLSCDESEYVPFFVIVNPGGWNPEDSDINNFCALMMRGGYVPGVGDINEPIRWYNIYDEPTTVGGVASRYIQYPADWLAPGNTVGRALFFAAETGADTGEFEYNFGNIEDLQNALGFAEFKPGTTIAFYYIDPNDFDDMSLATIVVADRPHSETYLTNAAGTPVDTVSIGNGGLYVRVYDGDANIDACCQDSVVVHLCDPHNEDDSEYWVLDEVSNDSGIFASQAGMALLPVWDAVGGYQLVFDSWTMEAFNEDTIYVRYNSVDYLQQDLNLLGDFSANDGAFPPRIDETSSRNQPWDVSFDFAKVYDTQVFDGTTHNMRFLNGRYEPVVEDIPVSGSLYLEVVDPDQNEDARRAELIRARWNRDATAADDLGRAHLPRYDGANGLPDPTTLTPDAGEDSAPIWWLSEGVPMPPEPPEEPGQPAPPPPPPPQGDSDIMTPAGLVDEAAGTPYVDPYLGGPQWNVPGRLSDDVSITNIPETVKVFIWNAQNGNWEAIDLKEYGGTDTGVFRSTTCVLVSTASDGGIAGMGNLGSSPGDTIMAFYQDPSNHSDVSIISVKVSEGGAAGTVPPTPPTVEFDAAQYMPGDTVVITVTDSNFAGAGAIEGDRVLVLTKDGQELMAWNSIPAVATGSNQFQVAYTLAEDETPGTLTATYQQPFAGGQQATATAQVISAEVSDVTDVRPVPEVLVDRVLFTVYAQPTGAVVDEVTVTIYDLTGRKVDEVSGTGNTAEWTGAGLRNGAYIYVAVVKYGDNTKTFRGFVYINR